MLEIPKSGLKPLLRVRRPAKRQEEIIDVVRQTTRQTDERSFVPLQARWKVSFKNGLPLHQ